MPNDDIQVDIEINQVGKRWFNCVEKSGKAEIKVEATFSNGFNRIYSPTKSAKAGYQVYDWIPARIWTLTGKGSKRFRAQIESALEIFYKGLPKGIGTTE